MRVRVPTTLNAVSVDRANWRALGVIRVIIIIMIIMITITITIIVGAGGARNAGRRAGGRLLAPRGMYDIIE